MLLVLGVLLLAAARVMERAAKGGRGARTGAVESPGKGSNKSKSKSRRGRGKGGASRVPSDEHMGILEAPLGAAESGDEDGDGFARSPTDHERPKERAQRGTMD